MPAAGGTMVRHERPDAVDDTEEVHLEGPPPVLRGLLPDRRAGHDHAGVVADDVDPAELGLHLRGEVLQVLGTADVDPLPDAVAPPAASSLTAASSAPCSTSASTTASPRGGERLDQRPPDPARAAGDDGDLPGLELHDRSFGTTSVPNASSWAIASRCGSPGQCGL